MSVPLPFIAVWNEKYDEDDEASEKKQNKKKMKMRT
jgi:hypothetical protein